MTGSISRRSAQKRIAELRDEIAYHEKKYYVDNDPQISDAEFDGLMRELEELEARFPDLITPESPTQRVGEKPVEGFVPVVHDRPMLSIDNCYDEQGLRDFEDRVRRLLPGRGDRLCGRAQDRRARHLHPLPGRQVRPGRDARRRRPRRRRHRQRQDDPVPAPVHLASPGIVEVRGEIYLPTETFLAINREREEKEEPLFANPRNAAAGSIRLLDAKEVAARNLDVFLYYLFVERPGAATRSGRA